MGSTFRLFLVAWAASVLASVAGASHRHSQRQYGAPRPPQAHLSTLINNIYNRIMYIYIYIYLDFGASLVVVSLIPVRPM